ncbi:MAG TPA: hypothetical protein VI911_08865 [Patescibacteria group bacterium]|nr:MAG: hypothetical protein UR43_C0005G0059 [candidate division TM6 bacterium GW2011_GWF2_33_332]HLD91108.1 hypothetical protein [Patescibacteria group bacterium]
MKKAWAWIKGIILVKELTSRTYDKSSEGNLYNQNNEKIKVHINGADREIITDTQTQTLTNKTINADTSTITNINTTNIKTSILDTATTGLINNETHLATSASIYKALADAIATKDQASEISYDNAVSGLVATDVQAAIDEVEGRLGTAETNIGNVATDLSNHELDKTTHGVTSDIVGKDDNQTLTNKTINADNSTISNINTTNIKSSILDTATTGLINNETHIATSACIYKAINDAIANHDQASEITYDNAVSGLVATDVQDAIDEVEGRLETAEGAVSTVGTNLSNHITNVTDAHDASAISTIDEFTYSNSSNVQDVLDDLDAAIATVSGNTGTVASDLNNHILDTTTHGTTSDIVGKDDNQTLTNKTMDADNNTFTNFEHGAEVDDPSSGVHGVTGSIVGTSDTQELTNKTYTNPEISGTQTWKYAKQKTGVANLQNNQTNTNVLGMNFHVDTHCVEILAYVFVDATVDYYQMFKLNLVNKNGTWVLDANHSGDVSGITFDVSAGQVTYSSPNFAGFSSAFIKYFATSIYLD